MDQTRKRCPIKKANYDRKYYLKHKEKKTIQAREYVLANAESTKKYKTQWNHENAERIRTQSSMKYKKNRKQILYAARDRSRKCMVVVMEYMGGKCATCGLEFDGSNFYAFDRHHVDASEKLFNVNMTTITMKGKALMEEVDKCILLCVLCHRQLHGDNEDLLSMQHETLNEQI